MNEFWTNVATAALGGIATAILLGLYPPTKTWLANRLHRFVEWVNRRHQRKWFVIIAAILSIVGSLGAVEIFRPPRPPPPPPLPPPVHVPLPGPSTTHSVYFDKGSAAITEPYGRSIIEGVAKEALKLPHTARIKLIGYGDASDGPDPAKIALQRAQNVEDKLVQFGVPRVDIDIQFSGQVPTAGKPEPLNRRVDIFIKPRPAP